jgi:acyl carrier protein
MEKNQILAGVNEICREVFHDPQVQITPETSAKDIANWDSMSNLFLIDAIERKYKFKFTLDEIMNAQNIGQLFDIIAERGQL